MRQPYIAIPMISFTMAMLLCLTLHRSSLSLRIFCGSVSLSRALFLYLSFCICVCIAIHIRSQRYHSLQHACCSMLCVHTQSTHAICFQSVSLLLLLRARFSQLKQQNTIFLLSNRLTLTRTATKSICYFQTEFLRQMLCLSLSTHRRHISLLVCCIFFSLLSFQSCNTS